MGCRVHSQYWDPIVWVSGVCQTSLFGPFFHYYISRFVRDGTGYAYTRVATADEAAIAPEDGQLDCDEWAQAAQREQGLGNVQLTAADEQPDKP